MSRPGDRALGALLVPWLAYLAVTVAAPAVNGAWRRPDFAAHVLLTLVTSGGVLAMWWLVRGMVVRRARARQS